MRSPRAQGLGASFSATLAGLIIVSAGYSSAFLVLAGIAAVGFVLYLVAMPETYGFKPPRSQGQAPDVATPEAPALSN